MARWVSSGRSSPKLCHSPSEIEGRSSPLRPQRRKAAPDVAASYRPGSARKVIAPSCPLAGEAGGRCADEAREVAVQVGLVVEADRDGDVGDGLSGQQPSSCGLDAAPGEVAVGRK